MGEKELCSALPRDDAARLQLAGDMPAQRDDEICRTSLPVQPVQEPPRWIAWVGDGVVDHRNERCPMLADFGDPESRPYVRHQIDDGMGSPAGQVLHKRLARTKKVSRCGKRRCALECLQR